MSRDRADEIVGEWLKAFAEYARNMKPPRRFTLDRMRSRLKRKAKV